MAAGGARRDLHDADGQAEPVGATLVVARAGGLHDPENGANRSQDSFPAASVAAASSATRTPVGSAIPCPAMSNAVP